MARIEEEKKEMRREEQEIQASIIKHRELEQQQKQAIRQTNKLLQQHQLQQIDFKQQLKQVEKNKLKQEIALNEVRGISSLMLADVYNVAAGGGMAAQRESSCCTR